MPSSIVIPESILERLAPGYREFIESNPSTATELHGLEWSPRFRQSLPPSDMGRAPPVPVGSIRTIDLGDFSLRVMIPGGEAPSQGWPVLLYVHGGGWVFGDAAVEDSALSRVCTEAQCVTVSVEYRLAPEHPFPAGLDDTWNSLLWLHGDGKEQLQIDPQRVALMGSSAGANLVAVVAQRASLASPKIPITLQVLLVPVIDVTFSATDRARWSPSMIEHEGAFDLPVLNMLWFRDLYLPNIEDRARPEASPVYQVNKTAFQGMPHTWIVIAELDSLRSDGELYAEKLQSHGVPVTLKLMKGEYRNPCRRRGTQRLTRDFTVGSLGAPSKRQAHSGLGRSARGACQPCLCIHAPLNGSEALETR